MLERLLLLCEKYPLDFVSHFSSSLPIILGFIRYKYLSSSSKLIVLFFLFYFLKETYALWLSIIKKNSLHIQNTEALIETGIILAIGFFCITSASWRRLAILIAISCLVTGMLTYKSDTISSGSLSTFRLFAIFFCLSYFNKILTDVKIKNILLHTLFWFSTGLLIYSAGTFFIMLFSEYWYKDINKVSVETFDRYWNASQILFILFCLLTSYGLWTSKYDRENTI